MTIGVSEFPKGLGELRRLDGLQADGCPLTPILATLYAKDPLLLVKVHDTQLLSLDLSDAGLDEVPQQVLHLTQLTSLNLLKNTIKVSSARPQADVHEQSSNTQSMRDFDCISYHC